MCNSIDRLLSDPSSCTAPWYQIVDSDVLESTVIVQGMKICVGDARLSSAKEFHNAG
jgi:hypothetical protein